MRTQSRHPQRDPSSVPWRSQKRFSFRKGFDGRIRFTGMLLEDLLEFLEKGLGEDAKTGRARALAKQSRCVFSRQKADPDGP